jgi:hypothetical protein
MILNSNFQVGNLTTIQQNVFEVSVNDSNYSGRNKLK